jgi:hypothetical protein
MHQYHLGSNEEERDGELVASKVFYQTQPWQSGNSNSISNVRDSSYDKIINKGSDHGNNSNTTPNNNLGIVECYNGPYTNYDQRERSSQFSPNLVVQGDGSIIRLAMDANKVRVLERKWYWKRFLVETELILLFSIANQNNLVTSMTYIIQNPYL